MAGLLAPMQDLLRPIVEQLEKLWTRVDLTPVIRWGTVTQADPLRVQLDGDAEPLPLTPQTTLRELRAGDRVVCVEQHRRVLVVQAATPALPEQAWFYGPSGFQLTGGASSWHAVPNAALVFTPPRDLWVDVSVGAVVKASSGGGYVMIGVNITGGVTLAPDAPPDGGASMSSWTPFCSSTVDAHINAPTKRIRLPGGVPTTFTFYTRRNVSSGTHTCNYAIGTIRPVRWA